MGISGPSHVGNTSSNWTNEFATLGLESTWMGDRKATPDSADKNKGWAPKMKPFCKSDGGQTLIRHTGSGKVITSW